MPSVATQTWRPQAARVVRRSAVLIVLACGVARAQSAPASAQVQATPSEAVPTSEPPGYAEAVEAGLSEHEVGHYEEARIHFERAHAIFANARTERALGNVEFELRNYGEAVRHLERALASDVRPLDAKLRDTTEKLLARARVYVGQIHVDIEPGSATVSVDGITVANGPRASLSLLVGEHVLEFHASGRLPERRLVQVKGGESTVIQVVLPQPPANHAAALTTSAGGTRDEPRPLRKQWWLWTAVGVGVAAIVAGTAVAIANNGSETHERQLEGGSSGVVLEVR
jgi:hypothetical protein